MKKRILFVLALFFMLTGFNGGDRIVEQNGVSLQERVSAEDEPPRFQGPLRYSVVENCTMLLLMIEVVTSVNSVQWFYNGKEINVMDDRYRMSFKNKIATLAINDIDETIAGRYKVLVKNKAGELGAIIDIEFSED